MNNLTPRLRMFAGPNGSGKSTIKEVINKELLGIYINPDELEKEISKNGFLNLNYYQIESNEKEILDFFNNSTLLKKFNLLDKVKHLNFNDNKLNFSKVPINSYFASVCSDFMRQQLLEKRISFSFETVMSSYDKVELLKTARKLGYRVYIYFVATDDPLINISRVQNRVSLGGHDVPEDKIITRYARSLKYASDAISHSNRAYIFDNSESQYSWLCEITENKKLEFKEKDIPVWFYKYIYEPFNKK